MASAVVPTAARSDTQVASRHSRLWKYSRYQRSDQEAGGKVRKRESEKLMGITTSVGATRNSTMSAQRGVSHQGARA